MLANVYKMKEYWCPICNYCHSAVEVVEMYSSDGWDKDGDIFDMFMDIERWHSGKMDN